MVHLAFGITSDTVTLAVEPEKATSSCEDIVNRTGNTPHILESAGIDGSFLGYIQGHGS
jgi:hypothetical protein